MTHDPRNPACPLIADDPWLAPHEPVIRQRMDRHAARLAQLEPEGGLLGPVSQIHHYLGLNRGEHDGAPGVWYREWAPNARQLHLIGDFNNWDRTAHPMQRDDAGVWHLFIPDDSPTPLTHGSRVKVHVIGADGSAEDRIPACIRRAVQDAHTLDFAGQHWAPPQPYQMRHPRAPKPEALRIYEAHVGLAVEEPRIGTWAEFTDNVLPRVRELGYNALQLMAVQEHPYYGSAGYQVSNFFAPSSRFGTPEELMALIDAARGMGLLVIMDLVHSHAVSNRRESLNAFDGTDSQYFHPGERGRHPAWDSLCFNYAKLEVQQFLLSNVRYWIETVGFDGFRFDGVTSMLYHDHGLERQFSRLDDYFDANVDDDALLYLTLANDLAHQLHPDAITIAEDMSGMPGIARASGDGGLGFDYRLAMGVPDYWIKLLKHQRDEQWPMDELFQMLLNRRHDERHIGYVESHDQAMVGDKTIAFRLMDADQYWHMSASDEHPVIDRGIALHKLIRLITFALAGEGWLNFMGNEFGHPEWIDFPRQGNDYSFHYARRQWSLRDDDKLRYRHLNNFDAAMQQIDRDHHILSDKLIERLLVHEDRKLLVFRRGPLVFAFNFHPTASYDELRIPVPDPAEYRLILDADASAFSGHARVQPDMQYPLQHEPAEDREQSLLIYLPSRSAQVLAPLT